MSALPSGAIDAVLRWSGAGRFVPYYRNRPIGSESVRAEAGASGRLRVRAETDVAVGRFSLRQTVIAAFAPDLRPEWCTVEATVNARPFSLAVEVGRDRAVVAYRSGKDGRTGRCDLTGPPLLLVDNCFASHALAALSARGQPSATQVFVSLPACEDLPVTRSGTLKVLLGGREYAPPALSLRLSPDLEEHVWVAAGWVERLVIPRMQMRVEWILILPTPGGSP